jgi:hypothetical protein
MCRAVTIIFALLYFVALALLAIGTFGWFGQERDPLAEVFLMPLGLPWTMLFSGAPAGWLPWIGIGAPAVNLVILWTLCRVLRT